MAWTMLRPGGFASNALRWAPTIRAQGSVYMPYPEGKYVPIDPRDIAAVAAKVLSTPGHEGKTYTLTGSKAATGREQVEAISAALGKPVKIVEVPEAGARAGMQKSGMPDVMVDAIMELMKPRPEFQGHVTPTVRELTGREARTFPEWARDHVASFK
jgi:uncharacterized protein YbjT (DUF2867 family)